MMTPQELFNSVVKSTGDRIAAIRTIRERFGLDLKQAKEVILQAEGVASSLDEYQERIANELEKELEEQDRQLLEDWTRRLSSAVAAAVREFGPRLNGAPVVRLSIDCHPWNGYLQLALLTASEADGNESLLAATAMAAWNHYDFSDGLTSWLTVVELMRLMKTAYYAADDRAACAEAYLRACAEALKGAEVNAALNHLKLDSRFRLSVTHPDDDREFCTPEGEST